MTPMQKKVKVVDFKNLCAFVGFDEPRNQVEIYTLFVCVTLCHSQHILHDVDLMNDRSSARIGQSGFRTVLQKGSGII